MSLCRDIAQEPSSNGDLFLCVAHTAIAGFRPREVDLHCRSLVFARNNLRR